MGRTNWVGEGGEAAVDLFSPGESGRRPHSETSRGGARRMLPPACRYSLLAASHGRLDTPTHPQMDRLRSNPLRFYRSDRLGGPMRAID